MKRFIYLFVFALISIMFFSSCDNPNEYYDSAAGKTVYRTNAERLERWDQPIAAAVVKPVEGVCKYLMPFFNEAVSLILIVLTYGLWWWLKRDSMYRVIHYVLMGVIYLLVIPFLICGSVFINPDAGEEGVSSMLLIIYPLMKLTQELVGSIMSSYEYEYDASGLVLSQVLLSFFPFAFMFICFLWKEEWADISFLIFAAVQLFYFILVLADCIRYKMMRSFGWYLLMWALCLMPLSIALVYSFLGYLIILIVVSMFISPVASGTTQRRMNIWELRDSAGQHVDDVDDSGQSIHNGNQYSRTPDGGFRDPD